ncbi:hypothetical protein D8B26_001205 [Coccidioides posadasii str. Silveira]|uniref:Uncharacterized protein n=3 Tax=Coccidioides posadasii TaxID=199306 RepID=E9DAC0_COCPS|nr:hypothetical protein CPC735_045010 [Coccidioides posadasii C735 delta SOWgp]EER23131.1 hypothetical protein CPC735_045010 [Coccidioides posadasii C735 delta SOWgp]EFW16851.1 conserved hypothetical protein [Coccidioides posadasii str. Silveira]KMM64390.1 hypothetical protein CPAG_00742 [Coccidioides posadasii RMSCC 3488]QVM06497.1 hypothetical protein D8B26_001205 [Coccidioides posadasii str. Silveira]|eukprot:XP_003065276.1 hypothetical protein CPC735_045010 [Coccidioides posadasii C735 delta SOWgp]
MHFKAALSIFAGLAAITSAAPAPVDDAVIARTLCPTLKQRGETGLSVEEAKAELVKRACAGFNWFGDFRETESEDKLAKRLCPTLKKRGQLNARDVEELVKRTCAGLNWRGGYIETSDVEEDAE